MILKWNGRGEKRWSLLCCSTTASHLLHRWHELICKLWCIYFLRDTVSDTWRHGNSWSSHWSLAQWYLPSTGLVFNKIIIKSDEDSDNYSGDCKWKAGERYPSIPLWHGYFNLRIWISLKWFNKASTVPNEKLHVSTLTSAQDQRKSIKANYKSMSWETAVMKQGSLC